jgi:hypothetical protein
MLAIQSTYRINLDYLRDPEPSELSYSLSSEGGPHPGGGEPSSIRRFLPITRYFS